MFICDNNSNDPDIHFLYYKSPFLLITFFPLIVTSKNRFSMITICQQFKLKARLPRCKLQLAGSTADVHSALCRRAAVPVCRRATVQVCNCSSPVLGVTDSARCDCQKLPDNSYSFHLNKKMALSIYFIR